MSANGDDSIGEYEDSVSRADSRAFVLGLSSAVVLLIVLVFLHNVGYDTRPVALLGSVSWIGFIVFLTRSHWL